MGVESGCGLSGPSAINVSFEGPAARSALPGSGEAEAGAWGSPRTSLGELPTSGMFLSTASKRRSTSIFRARKA